jgi:hypothetical protein
MLLCTVLIFSAMVVAAAMATAVDERIHGLHKQIKTQ